ncbi:MAG TPA: hypothetical protein EYQ50_11000, partial [Verrucomicrobiales bacterium]|nr:hypothetical protein [Verrucomicrobiales bacterium]
MCRLRDARYMSGSNSPSWAFKRFNMSTSASARTVGPSFLSRFAIEASKSASRASVGPVKFGMYSKSPSSVRMKGYGPTTRSTPVAVSLPSGRTAVDAYAGGYHTCVILDDDSLYCWGRNGYGQLGDGTTTHTHT